MKKLNAGNRVAFTGVAKLRETVTLIVFVRCVSVSKFPIKSDQLFLSINKQPWEIAVPALVIPVRLLRPGLCILIPSA